MLDVLIVLSSYFLHWGDNRKCHSFLIYCNVLTFLEASDSWDLAIFVCILACVFGPGDRVICQHFFCPFTSSSLPNSSFFWPFRVLNSSFLGKVLLIVIGQNLLWWGEGVQLFIFLWSCQFEKKWSPLVERLFSCSCSLHLSFYASLSLFPSVCSLLFLFPPSVLIFSSRIMFEPTLSS